jgi:hypothetical protein
LEWSLAWVGSRSGSFEFIKAVEKCAFSIGGQMDYVFGVVTTFGPHAIDAQNAARSLEVTKVKLPLD